MVFMRWLSGSVFVDWHREIHLGCSWIRLDNFVFRIGSMLSFLAVTGSLGVRFWAASLGFQDIPPRSSESISLSEHNRNLNAGLFSVAFP